MDEVEGLLLLEGILSTSQRSSLDAIPTVSLSLQSGADTELSAAIQDTPTSNDRTTTPLHDNRQNLDHFALCSVIPEYPKYNTMESRLLTFESWRSDHVAPQALAEAGFFYTSEDDIVTCFHCGVSVCDWIHEEKAWTSHAKHSPLCTFIYIKCGIRFIDSCLKGNTMVRPNASIIEPGNDRYKCKVCLEKEIGVCYFPCDHSVTCIDCAPGISRCPMCREPISGVFRMKFID